MQPQKGDREKRIEQNIQISNGKEKLTVGRKLGN